MCIARRAVKSRQPKIQKKKEPTKRPRVWTTDRYNRLFDERSTTPADDFCFDVRASVEQQANNWRMALVAGNLKRRISATNTQTLAEGLRTRRTHNSTNNKTTWNGRRLPQARSPRSNPTSAQLQRRRRLRWRDIISFVLCRPEHWCYSSSFPLTGGRAYLLTKRIDDDKRECTFCQ